MKHNSCEVGVAPVETRIPARLDRLPWARFHWLVVMALGITWVLDGLEVTIVGSIGPILQDRGTLGLSPQAVGMAASAYLLGAVVGAIGFGWLTDRLGRRPIFNVTLGIYLAGVILTALSWNGWTFAAFRLITGLGIGGEYAAINSAIDELIPARLRGRVDLIVNGSYWLGAAAGAAMSLLLLDAGLVPRDWGWRLGFAVGGVLGLIILYLRRFVPESPRWLLTHGRNKQAEEVVHGIEERVTRESGRALPPSEGKPLTVHPRRTFRFGMIMAAMLQRYRGRSMLALALMIAQAFLYNAVFFAYGLVLSKFYGGNRGSVGIYILPLAAGNFLGPLVLGHFFDTVGRRRMVAGTYGLSGLLLIAVAILFGMGALTAWTQTLAWVVIFFFASPASSSAYLTASETFPLETRAMAIALFYAAGTAIGGIAAPSLFGWLIDTGEPWAVSAGYAAAALLMLAASFAEVKLGVDAEGKSLEDVAQPLSGRADA